MTGPGGAVPAGAVSGGSFPGGEIRVAAHHKGFPAAAVGHTVGELVGLGLPGPRLPDPADPAGGAEFGTPVLLLRQDALDGNLQAMRQFCQQAGLSLAPHVKTTMSPEIISRQLAYGAWAVTVATGTQLRTVRELGVRRVLLANQLADPAVIAWLGAELDRDPAFTALCYVDSAAGVALLARTLAGRGQRRPLPVLLELGIDGGRTGARTAAELAGLARQVAAAPPLRLAGVGGFEGIIDIEGDPGRLDLVASYLHRLRDAADAIAAATVDGEVIVTAGGSAFPELVRDVFDTGWRAGRPVRVVLRSGCYATHDSGAYQRLRAVVGQRYQPLDRPLDRPLDQPLELTAALELWARVLSCPEPGLALADFGKRDTGIDAGFPVPWYLLRTGTGTVVPAPPAAVVVALNDQHAYLAAAPGAGPLDLAVGDLVGFGVSHPCTTFDKWRLIPMVGADRRLAGAAQTLF